jgi:hypothetical protein
MSNASFFMVCMVVVLHCVDITEKLAFRCLKYIGDESEHAQCEEGRVVSQCEEVESISSSFPI